MLLYFGLLLAVSQAEIIHVSIPEEVPVGTVVTTLFLNGQYEMYNRNEAYFQVTYDGIVKTKARIDREEAPFNDPDNPYEVKILHGSNLIQLIVTVIDINDNRPIFKINQETISISEGTNIGFEKFLPEAIDIDYGINSTQGYRIESGNIDNTFEIVMLKPANQKFFYLRVKRSLDRETTAEFDLKIIAYDGAYPPKMDTLYVRVIIEDENDSPPEFNQTQYFASVKENARIGTEILTVKATDRDAGSNARIVYSFDRQFSSTLFMINKYTGAITLQGRLDYETNKNMFLIVLATDEAEKPRSARVYVNIELIDVNDNKPEIEIMYNSASDTVARVDEDAMPGDPVVTVRITDKDTGDNGRVTCEMQGEQGLQYFKLVASHSPNIWYVRVRKPPNREVAEEYSMSITARDHGIDQQHFSLAEFKIVIMDINDHYPLFDPPSYAISILENTSPGTDIITVSATDADDGPFGDITYEIKSVTAQDMTPDPMTWFEITPKTGIIRNRIKLDREKYPSINIVILAKDGAETEPKEARATVVITLLDENDNDPIFPQSLYEANIKNTLQVGSNVVLVRARDYDDGSFGAVEYDITIPPTATPYFKVQPTTGQISVAQPLAKMDYQVIKLRVIATDGGGRKGEADVRINIFGENRYAPILEQKKYVASVDEDVMPPMKILTIGASDQDSSYFGEIHFELLGDTEDRFQIDKNTGEIFVIDHLDYETTREYNLRIRAFNNYDGTDDNKDDMAELRIAINDENDEPPRFEHRQYNLTAFTEDPNSTVLGTIIAVDPDSGDSGKVHYTLIGGNEKHLFKLRNTDKGAQILINGALQYMAGNSVNLLLEAQDDDPDTINTDQTIIWISILEGKGDRPQPIAARWQNTYLPIIIGLAVFVCFVLVVAITIACCRSKKSSRRLGAKRPFDYDGYAEFDEQAGLEPDTVKAYNIDGGGESDRLSAFEALTNQLNTLQYDYIDKPKGFNNYFEYGPDKNGKLGKSHLDSEGYFSLSDPAFNESPKYNDQKNYINQLLNNQNIYTNVPQPNKQPDEKYVPLSPPVDHKTDFGGRLPPTLDHNYLPMSPSSDVFDRIPEDSSPPEIPVRDHGSINSISAIDNRQDLAEMVQRLDELPPPAAEIIGSDIRTSNNSGDNSDHSADF